MYIEQSLIKLSTRLSVRPSHHCGRFAAVGPAARRCRSVAARPALSSKCAQCHVLSWIQTNCPAVVEYIVDVFRFRWYPGDHSAAVGSSSGALFLAERIHCTREPAYPAAAVSRSPGGKPAASHLGYDTARPAGTRAPAATWHNRKWCDDVIRRRGRCDTADGLLVSASRTSVTRR